MDFSSQYQQQTQDPSGVHAYDQSAQAYYAFHQFNQYIQQQYPYYAQDYTHAHHHQQQSSQELALIHPPGVPYYPQSIADQRSLQQQQQLNSSDSAVAVGINPAAATLTQMTQFGGNMVVVPEQQWQGNSGGFGPVTMRQQVGQTTHTGGGRRGGRPFRGGPRHFGSRPNGSGPPFCGRGRGRGRGGRFPSPADNPLAFAQGESSQILGEPLQHFVPPPRMAWCELCRVDCNTPEILEQHKNGKRHKRNLQVYEELQKLADQKKELQKLNNLSVGQNEQIPVAEAKQEAPIQPEKAEVSEDKQIPTSQNKVETEQQKVSGEVELTEEPTRNTGMDNFAGRGRGLKRKMRGGRGGKWMRSEGSRRPMEPPKPKQVIPLICELCNVKCESQVVFESHLAGKKHLSNLKRFQGQQAILEQAALQALYPALQALYPALQALYPPNPYASTSTGLQLHQESVHGSQGLFPHPAPSMVPPGQAAPPGMGTTSASDQPPLLVSRDCEGPKPEHSQFSSEAEATGAPTIEAKSPQKPISAKPEAEPAAKTKSE